MHISYRATAVLIPRASTGLLMQLHWTLRSCRVACRVPCCLKVALTRRRCHYSVQPSRIVYHALACHAYRPVPAELPVLCDGLSPLTAHNCKASGLSRFPPLMLPSPSAPCPLAFAIGLPGSAQPAECFRW